MTAQPGDRHPGPSPAPRRWRTARWIALAAAATAIGLGAVFGSRVGKDPTLVDSPLIGRPVPTGRVPYLQGHQSLSLAGLRGKIVVVNFWASWCAACREEHPALIAAAGAYQNSGVHFVGVDYQDQHGSAAAFLNQMGRGHPGAYTFVTDPGSRLAIDFGIFGIPETFFINRRGVIVAKITGPSTFSLLASTLNDILAGRTPNSTTGGTIQTTPGPG